MQAARLAILTGQSFAEMLEMDPHHLRALRMAWDQHAHETNTRSRLQRGR